MRFFFIQLEFVWMIVYSVLPFREFTDYAVIVLKELPDEISACFRKMTQNDLKYSVCDQLICLEWKKREEQ